MKTSKKPVFAIPNVGQRILNFIRQFLIGDSFWKIMATLTLFLALFFQSRNYYVGMRLKNQNLDLKLQIYGLKSQVLILKRQLILRKDLINKPEQIQINQK